MLIVYANRWLSSPATAMNLVFFLYVGVSVVDVVAAAFCSAEYTWGVFSNCTRAEQHHHIRIWPAEHVDIRHPRRDDAHPTVAYFCVAQTNAPAEHIV